MKRTTILLRSFWFLSALIFPWLVLGPAGSLLESALLRLTVFIVLTGGGVWLFHLAWPEKKLAEAALLTTLWYASAHKLAAYLPEVSAYPFSLSWSEASRYYYASLFFSERIYGMAVPPSVLHPSRYLMQSIPFLIPQSPLWLHRLWQVILWIACTAGAAALLAWRLKRASPASPLSRPASALAFVAWAALFLFQGPVYYHLLVMVILILWGYHHNFWRTLAVVLLASAWAGISRVNWLPVPSLLAASLYLLQVPLPQKSLWRYLLPPALWTVLGSAVALGAQQAYQAWSGNPPEWFGSAFESALLWYRLMPNPTYPLGILPSIGLVSLPPLSLLALRLYAHRPLLRPADWLRLAGLAAALFVLFGGGVIVSLKIGGGSNLHNLDAFLTLLLVVSSWIYFGAFRWQTPSPQDKTSPHFLLAAAVAVPVLFVVFSVGPPPPRDLPAAQTALQTLRSTLAQTLEDGGDNLDGQVLFITQRHLLTFGEIEFIPLVPDYELVFLMEMAMAGNQAYLQNFHADLQNQRYAMIVSEPLATTLQGRNHAFGEENDAWVQQVSLPILCYYEPTFSLDAYNIQIFTPRKNPCP